MMRSNVLEMSSSKSKSSYDVTNHFVLYLPPLFSYVIWGFLVSIAMKTTFLIHLTLLYNLSVSRHCSAIKNMLSVLLTINFHHGLKSGSLTKRRLSKYCITKGRWQKTSKLQGVPRNMTVGKYFKMSSSIIF